MRYLGVEIGGTKLQVATVTAAGDVQSLRTAPAVPADGAEGILRTLAGLLDEACRGGDAPAAAGVGFGGPVDRTRGAVATSYHVAGWDGQPAT